MALDAAVVDQLTAAASRGILRQSDRADEASARQSDGAAFDMRLLGGVMANELIGENERANVGGLNTAIRTPSTIDHYALGGAPAGGQGAQAGVAAK